MALEKTVNEDKLEVIDGGGEWKVVQVRTATVITEDGTELSRSYHRHTISPGDDWSSESTEVKGMCDLVHTDAAKAAYQAWADTQPVYED